MKKIIVLLIAGLLLPSMSYEKTTVKYKKVIHHKVAKKTTPAKKEVLAKKEVVQEKVQSKVEDKKEDKKVALPTTATLPTPSKKEELILTEKVASSKVATPLPASSFYPLSSVQRPLVLPKGLIDGQAQLDYHYFTEDHLGANLYLKGRYSRFQDWEFTGETSIFPQTQAGLEFGGLRAGFLYRALSENLENPELALGFKIAAFGQGAYSLTKNNSFAAFPSITLKKQVIDRLSLQGELMPGIGNKEVGVASINTLGTFRTTPDFDVRLKLDLQNLGYSFDEIMSLTPAVEYHLNKDVDILGGVQVGLLGANQIGNNFFIGAASRF